MMITDLDTLVYSRIIDHLPDSSVASLSESCKLVYQLVHSHTDNEYYWLEKSQRLGVQLPPFLVGITQRELYIDLITTQVNRQLVSDYFMFEDLDSKPQLLLNNASSSGSVYLVRCLLLDNRVNPRASCNYALRLAADNMHTEIVSLILMDGRVDPSNGDWAVRWVTDNRYTEISKMLLNYR